MTETTSQPTPRRFTFQTLILLLIPILLLVGVIALFLSTGGGLNLEAPVPVENLAVERYYLEPNMIELHVQNTGPEELTIATVIINEAIMPFISSANIACGFHAGDDVTMNKTILLAKKYGVRVGAHPSFFDRENFGRTELELSLNEIYDLVQKQIKLIKSIAAKYDVSLQHVKPHGALYNMSATNVTIANAIALAVKD